MRSVGKCATHFVRARRKFLIIRQIAALAVAAFGLSGVQLAAQGYAADKPPGAMAQQMPGYLAHAGLEQRLGEPMPMTAEFTDEAGRTGELKSWFDGKPVAMALVYYKCVMMCPQVLHGLATGLGQTTLKPGRDFDVRASSLARCLAPVSVFFGPSDKKWCNF